MTILLTACHRCGRDHEPDRAAIIAGAWHLCGDCRAAEAQPPAAPPPAGRCHECGRPLRAGGRTICGRCLGVTG